MNVEDQTMQAINTRRVSIFFQRCSKQYSTKLKQQCRSEKIIGFIYLCVANNYHVSFLHLKAIAGIQNLF